MTATKPRWRPLSSLHLHLATPALQCRTHDGPATRKTGDRYLVTCPDCKAWLAQYDEAFPQAHPHLALGGAR